MNKLLSFIKNRTALSFLLFFAIGVFVAGFLHAHNMFHFPYFEDDEGTYITQAYAVGYLGKLSNYTYWYDHAPMGWVITALWMRLTGGPFTFGYSLNSGRMFMLFVHLVSSACIFLIVRKFTRSNWIACISIIIFSVSPLGVYFQRRLLLDNIMTFLLLISLTLLLFSRQRLQWIIFSAFLFGLAVLSKENAIFVLPGYLLILLFTLHKKQRLMGIVLFSTIVILCISFYVSLALFKGELFPGNNHVSLIGSLEYQFSRGNKLPFWNSKSDIFNNFTEWLQRDSAFLIASIASSIWITIGFRKAKVVRAMGIIILLFWLFLIKGGVVINFYIIPVLAFGCLAIGITLSDIGKIKYLGPIAILVATSLWIYKIDFSYLKTDETSPQVKSIDWVKANLPSNATISVNDAQLLDLQISRGPTDPPFVNANWFTKWAKDPQIKQTINNDWSNINYLIVGHEFIRQLHEKTISFLDPTLNHAVEIASFGPISAHTYLNIDQRISTNGDWIKVYKVEDKTTIVLSDAWKSYLTNFVMRDGQVIDPQKTFTSSEDQAQTLLKSVIINDKNTFDLVWNWTHWHLQFRENDKLFSYKWQGDGKTGMLVDSESDTGADIDIATALLIAGKQWNNSEYINQAKVIISDIWQKDVILLGDGHYYLLAGSWAGYNGDIVTVNPSYLSPAAFRMFSKIDTSHDWNLLASESYYVFNKFFQFTQVGLPPHWFGVRRVDGLFVYPPDKNLTINFDTEAMRVYYNVAQDVSWFQSQDGLNYLKKSTFLVDYYDNHKQIPDNFNFLGFPNTESENTATYGVLLPYLSLENWSKYLLLQHILSQKFAKGSLGGVSNFEGQNWVWLGMALAQNKYMVDNFSQNQNLTVLSEVIK